MPSAPACSAGAMTQLQYYPQTQIRQGADRDRTLRVDHLSLQTRIASITVTAHAAPKIATNNRSPCDTPAASSRTYFESAPTAGDSNRRSRLAITQFAGRVMADTIVAKKASPDTKVAITPFEFYLFPTSCRSARTPPTVQPARPTGLNEERGCGPVPPDWHLGRPYPKGGTASRRAGPACRQIRVCDQPTTAKTLGIEFRRPCSRAPTR